MSVKNINYVDAHLKMACAAETDGDTEKAIKQFNLALHGSNYFAVCNKLAAKA